VPRKGIVVRLRSEMRFESSCALQRETALQTNSLGFSQTDLMRAEAQHIASELLMQRFLAEPLLAG
jgi:hypothetical protein